MSCDTIIIDELENLQLGWKVVIQIPNLNLCFIFMFMMSRLLLKVGVKISQFNVCY